MERNRAYSLLHNEAAGCVDEESAATHRQDCRSLLHEMIGEGYDFDHSRRTFHRHKALALAQIKKIAGADNILKQQQLAQSILNHYKGGGGDTAHVGGTEYVAHAAVIEGVTETLRILKQRNTGRYTREDRITQQVLLSAAVSKADNKKMLNSIARCSPVALTLTLPLIWCSPVALTLTLPLIWCSPVALALTLSLIWCYDVIYCTLLCCAMM